VIFAINLIIEIETYYNHLDLDKKKVKIMELTYKIKTIKILIHMIVYNIYKCYASSYKGSLIKNIVCVLD